MRFHAQRDAVVGAEEQPVRLTVADERAAGRPQVWPPIQPVGAGERNHERFAGALCLMAQRLDRGRRLGGGLHRVQFAVVWHQLVHAPTDDTDQDQHSRQTHAGHGVTADEGLALRAREPGEQKRGGDGAEHACRNGTASALPQQHQVEESARSGAAHRGTERGRIGWRRAESGLGGRGRVWQSLQLAPRGADGRERARKAHEGYRRPEPVTANQQHGGRQPQQREGGEGKTRGSFFRMAVFSVQTPSSAEMFPRADIYTSR